MKSNTADRVGSIQKGLLTPGCKLGSAAQNLTAKAICIIGIVAYVCCMGQAQSKQDKHGEVEVTTVPVLDTSIQGLITIYGRLYDIPARRIAAHITTCPGCLTKYLYQILLAVARLSKPTKSNIIQLIGAGRTSALRAVDHLCAHGYVRGVPKPRLIKPLQRWRVDTAYELTDKGWQALCKIIGE